MQEGPAALPVRGLASILDETFAVYSRQFKSLVPLVAGVQAPASFLTMGLYLMLGGGAGALIAILFVGILAKLFVYSAMTFAIGQQYLTGRIDIRRCYSRAWGRVATIVGLTAINAAALYVLLGPVLVSTEPSIAPFALVIIFVGISLAIYWSSTIQAVTVERSKAFTALRRSSQLVRGSWWRVFGIKLVLLLVITGLAIVVTLPFAAVLGAVDAEPFSAMALTTRFIGSLIVEVVVPPVWFIAGTLLYYDLRVRREEYSLDTLSRDMGIAIA